MCKIKVNNFLGVLFSVLFLCVILLVSEMTARFFVKDKGTLDRILNVLEQDPVLFWRQKSHLNVIFEEVRVKTNRLGLRAKEIASTKEKDTVRIVCLGASPTFGWGVQEKETYAYQLNELLNQKYPSRHIEVINGGMIGYSSYQGLKFFKNEILKLSPDIITVAYVINDVDKHRFFRSNGQRDSELVFKNTVLVYLENFLNKSSFFKLYRNLIIQSQSQSVEYFGTSRRKAYSKTRRVSEKEYKENIKEIIRLAEQNNIKVVLIKFPVNLPPAPEVPEEVQIKESLLIKDALLLSEHGGYKEAIKVLNGVVALNPYSSEAYFYLGRFYEETGDVSRAKESFAESKKKELNDCGRLGKKYNEIMSEIAKEKKVVLVDIVSQFIEYNKQNGFSLFQDARRDVIHPNREGHRIIGTALFNAFNENLFIN